MVPVVAVVAAGLRGARRTASAPPVTRRTIAAGSVVESLVGQRNAAEVPGLVVAVEAGVATLVAEA